MIGQNDATNRRTVPEQSLPNLCYPVVDNEPFVVARLSAETNIRMLGTSLRRVFPLPQDHKFDDLIDALDHACGRSSARL